MTAQISFDIDFFARSSIVLLLAFPARKLPFDGSYDSRLSPDFRYANRCCRLVDNTRLSSAPLTFCDHISNGVDRHFQLKRR